jgi:hypothetical protein
MTVKPLDDPRQTPTAKKRHISEGSHVQATEQFVDDSSDSGSKMVQTEDYSSLITYTIGGTVTKLNCLKKSQNSQIHGKRGSQYRY